MMIWSLTRLATKAGGIDINSIANIYAGLRDLAVTNADLTLEQITLDLSIIINVPDTQTEALAKALRNDNADDFIKEYTKNRGKYGLYYKSKN
jgi:hypothetical protein